MSEPRETPKNPASHLTMALSAFIGIGVIGLVERAGLPGLDPIFLVGSLGASAVLVFAAPDSPMSRTRNVLGGHLISALIGVACFRVLGTMPWFSGAVAVALAIVAMHRTGTLHAPGGATALIANIGNERVKELGFAYAFAPVLSGAMTLVAVAWLAMRTRAALERLDARAWTRPSDEAIVDPS